MQQSPASKKRLFCFEYERPTSSGGDAEKRCKYAHTCPAVRQGADDRENEDLVNSRLSMVAVISYLWAHPDECQSAEKWCVRRAEANRTRVDSSICFVSVSRFGVLDVDWRADFVCDCSRMPRRLLEIASNKDSETIEQIFVYIGIHGSLRLTAKQNLKPVMKACADRIYESNGSRLGQWDSTVFCAETKLVDWQKNGVYQFLFGADGLAQTLTHRPTGHTVTIGKRTPIDEEFTLKKNWSDLEAFVVYEDTVHTLAKFFKLPMQGPNAVEVHQGACKEWDDLYEDQLQIYTLAKNKLKAGTTTEQQGQKKFGQVAKEEAANQRLSNARQNMANKRKELENSRSVVLTKVVQKQKEAEAEEQRQAAAAAAVEEITEVEKKD
jgi:hypothetical protein